MRLVHANIEIPGFIVWSDLMLGLDVSHLARRLVSVAVISILFLYGSDLRGQTQEHHHPLHKDFYQQWKQPGTNASCCNARIVDATGQEIGDCEPSQARIREGNWEVWIRQIKKWVPVAPEKILRERNPNIFDAHVCWTPERGIICFVPPDTGG